MIMASRDTQRGFSNVLDWTGRPFEARSTAGVGYDIARDARTRRNLAIIAGLTASADRHLDRHTLGQLREICRAHDRQNSLFQGMLDRAVQNIFGDVFRFIPATGDKPLDKLAKEYIERRGEAEFADAAGDRDIASIARDTIRAVWTDGDIAHIRQPDGSLMTFEAEQVDNQGEVGLPGEEVVLGVAKNSRGRRTACYLRRRSRDTSPHRIDAVNVIFPAYRKRFGQTRGVPFLAAVLSFFQSFDTYLDSESLAAAMGAMLGFKLTRDTALGEFGGKKTNKDASTRDTFDQLQRFEPGMFFELQPGEDIAAIGSHRPGSNFDPYIRTAMRIIGVGVGMPLELLLLDFSQTNYSSGRLAIGEARKCFKGWQLFATTQLCRPWYRWQIARGIAGGDLPPDERLYRFRCQWPAWPYIDPVKDAEGDRIAMENHTRSPQEIIRERGGEPEEVLDEIADWQKMLAERGIAIYAKSAEEKLADRNRVTQLMREDNKDKDDDPEAEDR